MRQRSSCVVGLMVVGLTWPMATAAQDNAPETPPPLPPAAGNDSGPSEPSDTGPGDAESAPAKVLYKTPEECFAAAKEAWNQRDWRAFVACVSPGRRDELIGQMAATFAMMAQQKDADPRVKELVGRYLPADFDPMKAVMQTEDDQDALRQLVRRMPHRQNFFVEAMSLAFALEYPDPELAPKITELTGVDLPEPKADQPPTATGVVHLEAGDRQTQDAWSFEMFNDGWYLSMR